MKKLLIRKPVPAISWINMHKGIFRNYTASVCLINLLFSLLMSTSISSGQAKNNTTPKKDEVVLMTYNVRNCYGVDGKVDYQRVADIINKINPSVVALQELDSATRRSSGVIVLDTLAGLTNMYQVYGPAIVYLGGKYGLGVLSREKPLSWKIIPLPGREEKRCLLIVELEDFFFCCTHLSLNPEDRLRSAEIINEQFNEYTKPVFLAGDLNTLPESDPVKNILTRWQMLNNPANATIPSDYPRRCIDYIFALKNKNQKIKTVSSIVENETIASDHRPVWVIVNIKK